jgi:phospholipase/carboxylesterase
LRFASDQTISPKSAPVSKITNGSSKQPLSGNAPGDRLAAPWFGSNGADLISFAPQWQQAMPDALFLAPNAPQRCMMGEGYQWWALTELNPSAMAAGPPALPRPSTP